MTTSRPGPPNDAFARQQCGRWAPLAAAVLATLPPLAPVLLSSGRLGAWAAVAAWAAPTAALVAMLWHGPARRRLGADTPDARVVGAVVVAASAGSGAGALAVALWVAAPTAAAALSAVILLSLLAVIRSGRQDRP